MLLPPNNVDDVTVPGPGMELMRIADRNQGISVNNAVLPDLLRRP